ADVFLDAGYDVKKSEVHGMAQRGGSVTSHVRFGEKVASPIIPEGEADILFCSEKLEVFRWLAYCNENTKLIINSTEIYPPLVNLGEMEYPKNIEKAINSKFKNSYFIEATKLAKEAGDARAANVVMLGVTSKFLPIDEEIWMRNILAKLPKKIHELNKIAFKKGREAV
ncbi:MAG: indolepyruvate oxidoreductase subunit beta, partial [Deltaproteobacteria bacterium]|nr:indolepyruvate oxidoreductase subunit beta [Deltaproteobacteria bacterium]